MRAKQETMEEVDPAEESLGAKFFASFGRAIFVSCQLQYRLAHLYGVTFETARDGCMPRVNEKIFEGLKNTLGGVLQNGGLSGDLLADLQVAHRLRDYIVHKLFLETRSQQGTAAGLESLCERLEVATQFFFHVSERLDKQHTQVFLDAGVSMETWLAHRRSWNELDDEKIAPTVPLPKVWEYVRNVWKTPGPVGPTLVFEGEHGVMWQVADNGLAYLSQQGTGVAWAVDRDFQRYLQGKMKARPSRETEPPELRGSFNYDLRFEGGAILRISRGGACGLHYEIVPPRGGKKNRRRK
jgi:hypothetical protein